jgi:alkylhydroperoxidase family enzyme
MTKSHQVKPIATELWPQDLDFIVKDMSGNPINVHKLLANHPELLKAWWNFRNYSVKGGELGQRKGELVILRVAIHMQAWYEWGSHVERSLACGLTLAELEAVREKEPTGEWAEDEALLLLAVDALITEHKIPTTLLAQLSTHFSTQQMMDIMAIHGMYVILGCMINTWGLELDSHIAAKLPADIASNPVAPSFK